MADGILNLNKPLGPTSHDVVGRVRSLTGVRRVGHAGTLDPMATGVLLLCLGKATRVAEYLVATRKSYVARLRLGTTTDTYDAEGEIVAEAPVDVDRTQLEVALAPFRGTISQVPPMYSAIKRRGVPLYRLARQGIEVAREPRPVEVFRLELSGWEPPDAMLEITCSRGTYVRALAHDLGQALGCGAHLSALTRTASGAFRVEDAVTVEELALAASEDRWRAYLHPLSAALSGFPEVHLGTDSARRLCLGQAIPTSLAQHEPRTPDGGGCQDGTSVARTAGRDADSIGSSTDDGPLVCARGPDGRLLALVTFDRAANVLRPRKVFCSPET